MENFTCGQNSTLLPNATPDGCVMLGERRTEFGVSTLLYIVLELIIMLFVAFGNILVLAAVYKFPKLRTSTNTFVVSLSLADLLVAFLVLPLHILVYIFPSLQGISAVCLLRYCVATVSCGTSVITLMLISVDRYVAIEKPYRYRKFMSTTRSKVICGCIWTYTVSFGSSPLCGWNEWLPDAECTMTVVLPCIYILGMVCHILVIVIVMAVLNAIIFRTANSISAEINRQIRSVGIDGISKERRATNNHFLQNRKAAKTLAVVIGTYSVCTMPFAVFVVWKLLMLKNPEFAQNVPSWVDVVAVVTTILFLINSGINPIIYHRRIPEFREAFNKLLHVKTIQKESRVMVQI